MKTYEIVCVDDNIELLECYKDFLQKTGHEICLFSDAKEAFEYIKCHQKKIIKIFSDYKMEGMSGFELRRCLLKEGLDLPFSIVTGFYDSEMAIKAMGLKIVAFVEKPVQGDKLIDIFHRESKERVAFLQGERDLLEGMIRETAPMLEEMEETILKLEEAPRNEDLWNTYLRFIHTIKGTTACLGLDEIADFSHKYESFIGKFKNGKFSKDDAVFDVLLKAVDCLKEMYSCIEKDIPMPCHIGDFEKIFEFQEVKREENEKELGLLEKRDKSKDGVVISIDALENFMEFGEEAIILRNTIIKMLDRFHRRNRRDPDLEIIQESMDSLGKIISIQQERTEDMKKIPMDKIFRSLKRRVRDSTKKSGEKKVEIVFSGQAMMVDASIGKMLSGTLVHIVNNSLDHGIEDIQTRKAQGKKETGKIFIRCYEEGDDIIVILEDDGRGVDLERVTEKVLEKEIRTKAQWEKMNKKEQLNMIFEPGFTTAKQLTNVSGRGVGMAAVKEAIEEMKGDIMLSSDTEKGCSFKIVIPIPRSVRVIKSLNVTLGRETYNIPLENILEVIHYNEQEEKESIVFEVGGGLVFQHHKHLIPLVRLDEYLKIPPEKTSRGIMNIVVIKCETCFYGVVVDQVGEMEEIAVKEVKNLLSKGNCYLGASFVGYGEISLILNMKKIGKNCGLEHWRGEDIGSGLFAGREVVETDEKQYMLFDLNCYENYVIPLEKIFRLETISIDNIHYTGQQAIVRYKDRGMSLVWPKGILGLAQGQSWSEYLSTRQGLSVIVIQREQTFFGLVVDRIVGVYSGEGEVDREVSDRQGILGVTFIGGKIVSVLDVDVLLEAQAAKKKLSVA